MSESSSQAFIRYWVGYPTKGEQYQHLQVSVAIV